jgi:murein DD-endopeptidase MepM/ murein hydrolase activator NlpD
MPTFNTVAERDAYYANKIKTAGVAPQQGNFTSSTNAARAPVIPAVTPATAPKAAEQGSWITTRPTAAPAPATAPAVPTPAAQAQAPVQLDIPKPEPTVIEKAVTASQVNADKDAAAKAQVQGDYYKLWQQGEADVKAGIYKINPYPESYQDYRTQQSAEGQQNIDFTKQQNEIANKLEQSNLSMQIAQGKSGISGVDAAMAQSREGVTGTSKPLVAKGFTETQNKILADATTRVDAAKAAREQAVLNMERAQRDNDSKSASIYAGQIANADREIAQSKKDLLAYNKAIVDQSLDIVNKLSTSGRLDNATPDDIAALSSRYGVSEPELKLAAKTAALKGASSIQAAQFKDQTTALETLKSLVTAGISLPPSLVSQYANQTGLSADSLTSFNTAANTIMADKNLSAIDKQQQIKEMSLKLEQEQRGIWGQEMQKIDYINKQIAAGASQEEIDSLKTMMGITTDSKQEAETSLSQAKTKIAQYEANNLGKAPPEGTKEYYEYKQAQLDAEKAQAELNTIKGIPNEVGTYDVDAVIKDGLKTVPKENTKISTAIGSGVITGYGSKAWDKGLDFVISGGMGAEVKAPIDGTVIEVRTGHKKGEIGSFGNQVKIKTATGEEVWLSHLQGSNVSKGDTVNAGQVVGTQGNTGTTYGATGVHVDITMKNKNGGYYNAKDVASFLGNIEGAEKKTTSTTSLVPPEIKAVAEDAANGIITYSQMLSGAGKEGIKYKNEFSKIVQEKAAAEPDPLIKKMILSRAKGDPDTATEQSWTKAAQGFTQVLDLKDTLDRLTEQGKTGIITGNLSKLDPLDPDVSLLKGQMAGLVPTVARGTFGEVGVLTDKDIANYQKAIGDQSMSPEQINKATTNLIKTIYRNYTSGIDASPKNTANRIDQYKSIKSRLPAPIKSELGIKEYSQSPSQPSWIEQASKGFIKQLIEDQHSNTGELIIPEDMETKNPPVTKFKF